MDFGNRFKGKNVHVYSFLENWLWSGVAAQAVGRARFPAPLAPGCAIFHYVELREAITHVAIGTEIGDVAMFGGRGVRAAHCAGFGVGGVWCSTGWCPRLGCFARRRTTNVDCGSAMPELNDEGANSQRYSYGFRCDISYRGRTE